MAPYSPSRIRVSIYAVLAALGCAIPSAHAEIVIGEDAPPIYGTPLLDSLAGRSLADNTPAEDALPGSGMPAEDGPGLVLRTLPPLTAAPSGPPPLAFAQSPLGYNAPFQYYAVPYAAAPYSYGYYAPNGWAYAPPPAALGSRKDAGASARHALTRAHEWSQFKGAPVFSSLYAYGNYGGYYRCAGLPAYCGPTPRLPQDLYQAARPDNRDMVNYLLRRSHAFSRNAYDR